MLWRENSDGYGGTYDKIQAMRAEISSFFLLSQLLIATETPVYLKGASLGGRPGLSDIGCQW